MWVTLLDGYPFPLLISLDKAPLVSKFLPIPCSLFLVANLTGWWTSTMPRFFVFVSRSRKMSWDFRSENHLHEVSRGVMPMICEWLCFVQLVICIYLLPWSTMVVFVFLDVNLTCIRVSRFWLWVSWINCFIYCTCLETAWNTCHGRVWWTLHVENLYNRRHICTAQLWSTMDAALHLKALKPALCRFESKILIRYCIIKVKSWGRMKVPSSPAVPSESPGYFPMFFLLWPSGTPRLCIIFPIHAARASWQIHLVTTLRKM